MRGSFLGVGKIMARLQKRLTDVFVRTTTDQLLAVIMTGEACISR